MAAVAPAALSTAESPAIRTSTTTAIQPRPCTRTPSRRPAAPPKIPAMRMRRIRPG